jgi:hypothetical protein
MSNEKSGDKIGDWTEESSDSEEVEAEAAEPAGSGVEVPISKEIEKIVLSTDTVKLIFKDRYGREIEAVIFDATSGLWTVDFLRPDEISKDPQEDC